MRTSSPPVATSRGSHPATRPLLALAVVLTVVLLPAPSAAAAELPPGVSWTARLDGQSIDRGSTTAVRLHPGRPVVVDLVVQNSGNTPVRVPFVRLEGGVLGLTFFAYTTQVDLEVPPGGQVPERFPVRLLGLAEQASGLLPARVVLVDDSNGEITARSFRADVRGRANSVYLVFGLAVGGLAVLLLAGLLWRLARGRTAVNRWRRGLAFAAPGLGLGFLLTFTLSAFRWALPDAGLWSWFLAGGAVVGFTAGYLSPTPAGDDEPDEGADEDFVGGDEPTTGGRYAREDDTGGEGPFDGPPAHEPDLARTGFWTDAPAETSADVPTDASTDAPAHDPTDDPVDGEADTGRIPVLLADGPPDDPDRTEPWPA